MKKNVLLFAFIIIGINSSFSQKDDHSIWAVKFSPFQLFMGELNFSFEHRIATQQSIEISAGPTISGIGFTPLLYMNAINQSQQYVNESRLGGFISLAYRYYPLSESATAPRGLYISPELKFRNYTIAFKDDVYNLPERNGSRSQFMFKFNTGYQFWFGKTFALDLFLGLGIGTASSKIFYIDQAYDEMTGNWSNPKWKTRTNSNLTLVGQFGFKVGFGGSRKIKNVSKLD